MRHFIFTLLRGSDFKYSSTLLLGRLMSPPPPPHIYDTETDFSPPRSPRGSSSGSEWDRQTF